MFFADEKRAVALARAQILVEMISSPVHLQEETMLNLSQVSGDPEKKIDIQFPEFAGQHPLSCLVL